MLEPDSDKHASSASETAGTQIGGTDKSAEFAHTRSPSPHTDKLVHTRLGNFEIVEVLGEGTYGKVYKAQDVVLNRPVAIKFLKSTLDNYQLTLFEREAKAIAALSRHPNIVAIHHWGEHLGQQYFVLEFLDKSLCQILDEYPQGMPVALALRIVAECAEALYEAHKQGILHRDIKPANILVEGETLRAKVADFGLARVPDSTSSFTLDRLISGSPPYMSPEQASGESLDERTDIFSLGVTLYELLCGQRPFDGDTVQSTLTNVRKNNRVNLRNRRPDLPEAICHIVEKATAHSPAVRYQSANEFAKALRVAAHALEHSGQVTTDSKDRSKKSQGDPLPKTITRNLAMAGGALAALLIMAGVVAMLRGDGNEDILPADNTISGSSNQSAGADPLPNAATESTKAAVTTSASPQDLFEKYCALWSSGDFEAMHAMLANPEKQKYSISDWTQRLQKNADRYSLPKKWEIIGPKEELGSRSLWTIRVTYTNDRIDPVEKTTWAVKQGDGWYVGAGGLSDFRLNFFGPDS
ncbi:MAG: hypothetical protein AMXMBFR84_44350 [Candidatus Hydrogenedentota bacterium]